MNIESVYQKRKIEIPKISRTLKKDLLNVYKKMFTIRSVELILAQNKKKGTIIGPVHLAIGQEAIASGISVSLSKSDRVFGNHRSHGHLLALNTNLKKFFSEILARADGLSKGFGGSMHLIDKSVGFYGSTPIVGGTVPIATGSALESKLSSNKSITISYFGDSAVEEGSIQECFNLSSVMSLPIVYVVENNFYASHMHIDQRQPDQLIGRYAVANKIKYFLIDGNNPLEVYLKFKEALAYVKSHKKPVIFEALTYRWLGHVDWREDIDVGIKRSKADIILWKKRDPIKIVEKILQKNNFLTKKQMLNEKKKIKKKIMNEWNKSMKSKYPYKENLLKNVF